MSATIAILGGGRLAQAVAAILEPTGAEVRMWARRPAARRTLQKKLTHTTVADSVHDAAADAAMVFFAVPASGLREVAAEYGDCARGDQLVLHATRGVESGFRLPHAVIRAETCVRKVGVLGGPLHFKDLTSGRPLAAVLASRFDETAQWVRRLTQKTPVRVHPSRDVIGVEIAGIISNVSALAVGMVDALGLGDTARGVILTRGLLEASRLGEALGAEPSTFAGLAGVGDLIPRKVAATERHHKVGELLAGGETLAKALEAVRGEVEGVLAAAEAVRIAELRGLDLPLVHTIDMVLHGEAEAAAAIEDVLRLDLDLGGGLSARM